MVFGDGEVWADRVDGARVAAATRWAGEMIPNADGSYRVADDPPGAARCLDPDCGRFTGLGRFGGRAVCPPAHVMPLPGL